ncbi:MAG: glycosyltransferase, partial [Desulfobacterales bacterium]
DPNYYKEQFGVEGRKVILTFGLISPRKNIEDMIDALPAIVSKHPETAYIVLGATHPNVIRDQGESYRLSLQLRAREKGVEEHLIFHNRFVHLTELCEFLGAADIYATLYFNTDQAVSGTLAYALGHGKAIISTPYPYAEEMLNHGRGRIVSFHDSDALADQVIDLLDNEVERHAMRKRAYIFSRNMIWKEVARRYLELFIETKNEREQHPRIKFQTKTLSASPPELPQLKLRHLNLLTDDVGILQHAKFIVPQRSDGYCTDDNAQALVAVMMARELLPDDTALMGLACRYFGFLYYALNDDNDRFRNFMGYDRRWLEAQGSEDCHGRAIWGLGMAVALSRSESLTGAAMTIFERALQPMVHFKSPRAWAFGLVGIHAYLKRFSGDTEARRVRESLANALFDQFQTRGTDDWPWIEDEVSYSNAMIPQALLLSGRWLHR